MTPLLRRTATIGTATLGLSLALAGAIPAASAETVDAVAPAAVASAAPTPFNSGADKYELAAESSGIPADELRSQEAAGEITVTDNGFVLHLDTATTDGSVDTLNLERRAVGDVEPEGAPIPGTATDGSRPGAPVTIFLDFDGAVLQGTQWNEQENNDTLTLSPSAAGAAAVFRNAVWAVVAEDYAPFNVNVTTVDPGADALFKTSAGDTTYGSHVIITDSYDEVISQATGTSGLAFVGGTGSDFLTGAFVFTDGLGGANASTKNVGNTAAHESGHNFGLSHDGLAGTPPVVYYNPDGGLWAPTMGASFNVPISQWSNGSYNGSNNSEADLDVITARASAAQFVVLTLNGQYYDGPFCTTGDPDNLQPGNEVWLPNGESCDGDRVPLTVGLTFTDRADYAADDAGNSKAEATALENNGAFSTTGVIGKTDDVDVYSLIASGGPLTATVNVADVAPDLDAKLTLTDSEGNEVASNDPAATRISVDAAGGLDATIAATVTTGAYYLTVEGVGTGNPSTATPADSNGYTDYGSLGNYTLSGTAVEFVAQPLVIETPAEGAKVVGGSKIDVTGTATPGVTVTLAVGGTNVTTVVEADGTWAAQVTANAFGNTQIDATQNLDGVAVPGTDSVTVTAPVSAPVITSPTAGSTVDNATQTISGTGIAGATVTASVTDANGNVTTGQALVNADGTWSFALATPLPNGSYTVSAVQTINGVTSALSAPVAFSIELAVTTTGNGNDPVNVDGTLAATGNDLFGSPFILLAAALLMGGVVTTTLIRRRRAVVQS